MSYSHLNLSSFVKFYRKALPLYFCKKVIEQESSLEWQLHEWTNYSGVSESPQSDQEFLRTDLKGYTSIPFSEIIKNCVIDYSDQFNFKINRYSPLVVNKYEVGTKLIEHIDHKTNYFDGKEKGIPILTVIASLNDDYQGGSLIICKDIEANLAAGDLVVFPSNFMFPHSISTIERGTRFSINQWFW